MTATAPPPPATVLGEITPDRPLQDPSAVAGTPALAAIQTGLGAYLASVGYVAEHPLLYVNESEDPHVYVRFDVSADGLGFLDTTFVYSPSVSAQLDEIFTAYGVYAPNESQAPYRSDCFMGDRPIHAQVEALTTCRRESEIDWHETYNAVRRMRRRGLKPRRLRTFFRTLCRRFGSKRRALFPAFSRRGREEAENGLRPPFANLPLNRNAGRERSEEYPHRNWSTAAASTSAVAAACARAWRLYVEPRLIHAAATRGNALEYKTWLGGGFAHLGDEWRFWDVLYWSMKQPFEYKYYYEEYEFYSLLPGTKMNLMYEFQYLPARLRDAIGRYLESGTASGAQSMDSKCAFATSPMASNDDIRRAIFLFRRQRAVLAHRRQIDPELDWKDQLAEEFEGAGLDPEYYAIMAHNSYRASH